MPGYIKDLKEVKDLKDLYYDFDSCAGINRRIDRAYELGKGSGVYLLDNALFHSKGEAEQKAKEIIQQATIKEIIDILEREYDSDRLNRTDHSGWFLALERIREILPNSSGSVCGGNHSKIHSLKQYKEHEAYLEKNGIESCIDCMAGVPFGYQSNKSQLARIRKYLKINNTSK